MCLFLAFHLSVAFDACARLKEVVRCHIHNICAVCFDFTSLLRCVCENRAKFLAFAGVCFMLVREYIDISFTCLANA